MPLYSVPPRCPVWGDSLGLLLAPPLAAPLRGFLRVENRSVGGETSTQIATRFAADSAAHAWPTVIWAGTNNLNDSAAILADVAAMVAALVPGTDYLILTPLNGENGSSYYVGGSVYASMQTAIAGLFAAYPGHVYDLRKFLIAQANVRVAQDVIDVSHDIVPSSLRVDTVHLTAAGYALAALQVAAVIRALFLNSPRVVMDLPVYPFSATAGGFVGLGLDTPSTRLHVDMDGGFGAVKISNYKKHATSYGSWGVSGQASGMINGDVLGDVCWVGNTSGQFRISADNGGHTHLGLHNDGTVDILKAVNLLTMSTPAAPVDGGKLFVDLDGNGNHRLCVRFHTGSVLVLATEGM